MIKRIITLCIASLLFMSLPAAAVHILFHDGTELEVESIKVLPPDVITGDGKTFPLDSVKEITFQKAKEAAADETGTAAGADKDVRDLLALAKEMREKYPDANDALVLRDWMESRYKPNGDVHVRVEMAVLVLNEAKRDENVRVVEATNKKTWRSRTIKARSIEPDGTVHEFDRSTFVESKPKDDLQFLDARQDVIIKNGTIPGAKVGCIIHKVWESESFNREDPNKFDEAWWFQGETPVADTYLIVHVPKDKKLTWITRAVEKEETNPTEKVEGEWRTYTWRMKNLDAFVNEPDAPDEAESRPAMFATVFDTWDYQSDFLGKIHKERMVVTDKIKEKVEEIIKGIEGVEEKIAAIYTWMQENVEYLSIKGSLSSSQGGHPAAHTFGKLQGDCIDKAILFATMLKVIDVEAYPVILRTNGEARSIMDRIPILQCNHAINEIHLKLPDGSMRIFYLDATGSNYRYPFHSAGNHGVPVWNPLRNTVREIPVPPPADETDEYEIEVELKENGDAEVGEKQRFNGTMDMLWRYWLRRYPRQIIQNYLQNRVNDINPGGKLQGYSEVNVRDFGKKVGLDIQISNPKYAQSASGLLIFKLPISYRYILRGITLDKRRLPLKFTTSTGKKDKISINLPEGFVPRFLPEKFTVENPHLKYSATFRQESGKLVFEDKFERSSVRIPPGEYEAFRAACQKILKFIDTPIFFEKVEE